ncbi:MAG: hybrid sensor histidine kinase/response regulator [Pseudomonadota bacterium]|nr:hybrid sensor histidine kinase/response regulator [Pseudomonadota bacterium]
MTRLTAPAPAAPVEHDPVFSATIEVVESTYAYMPAALAGYLAGVAVVAMLYWPIAPLGLLLPWIGAFIAMCLVRAVVIARFRQARPQTRADWLAWRLRSSIGTVVAAAMWGATGWIFYGLGKEQQQATGLIVVIYTFTVAGIPVLSTQPRLYLGYAGLCLLPLVLRIALGADRYSYQLAGELVLIISLTAVLANSYRQALQRAIDLKVQADELAARLRDETVAADEARRQAEIANRAKTQFFTAASHDLRQPLHAMGLFAEALRQRVHQPELAQLVNSINESVDVLEGLFSELLDITRIDSGVIEVHPQHFEIGDLLRKLRLHFEPNAFEKGLALRLRGGDRVAFADPLLVERILRNLVSNAIRYTVDGSVLVSCRRRGERLLLQVWDTGLGIRAEHQQHVFDEFYQVPNTSRVSPDQSKGLGLGLAIVKRLADLMQAPLTLASEPGRGTVFTLELPQGRALRPSALLSVPGGKGPLAITLDGRRVVVVEDEPAVRAGLEVLLAGWGARIDSFESVAASRAWAEASDPVQDRPDLLIVDYRLEEGRTGLDAIRALRGRFGDAIPAILVTGSTMTGHDREAAEHNFHLLIKPVVPNKLRAMIAFKLGVR